MGNRAILRYVLPVVAAIVVAAALFGVVISGEVPVGSVAGTAVAQDSGNALKASVTLTAKDTAGDSYETYEAQCDENGAFRFSRIPTGWYKLSATTRAHHLDAVIVHVKEGKTERQDIELLPDPPYLELMVNQHVYTPGEIPQVICDGLSDSLTVDIALYSVKEEAIVTGLGGSLRELLGGALGKYDNEGRRSAHPQLLESNANLRKTSVEKVVISKRDREGLFTQRANLPKLSPGLYVLGATAGKGRAISWILVTDIGLVTKQSAGSVLAYAADLKTGAPLSGVDVTVYDSYSKNRVPTQGTTGPDGTTTLNMTSVKNRNSRWSVFAKRGSSYAVVSSWFSGGSSSDGYTIYAYTERPVYRPGQRVFFKGIVRKSGQNGYENAPGKNVTVEVQDGQSTLVYRDTGKTDEFGAYDGSFVLSRECASGSYTVITTV